MQMSLNKKDKEKAQELTKEILFRIKQMFAQHKNKVDRLNEEKNFGGRANKNDKYESMYNDLSELSKELSTSPTTQGTSPRDSKPPKKSGRKGRSSGKGSWPCSPKT